VKITAAQERTDHLGVEQQHRPADVVVDVDEGVADRPAVLRAEAVALASDRALGVA